jgi:hypothetical protein
MASKRKRKLAAAKTRSTISLSIRESFEQRPLPFLLVALVLFSLVALSLWDNGDYSAKVYKTSTCSCCGLYVTIMDEEGWDVEIVTVEDIETVMDEYQIPEGKQSCHLSLVDDYFIVGHVPLEVIEELLDDSPDIDGISLPGMPAGSPGMGGEKSETWIIYSIKDGRSEVYTEY